jgi:hypothetical protein
MEPKKERYRLIRGWILNFLAQKHPAPLHPNEIHCYLDDVGLTITIEELESHLCYLKEKGYIKIEEGKFGDTIVKKIRISADGLNILDKFIKDVGIKVEF